MRPLAQRRTRTSMIRSDALTVPPSCSAALGCGEKSTLALGVRTANIGAGNVCRSAVVGSTRRPKRALLGGTRPVTIKSDIEIARAAKMKPIAEVAAKVGIPAEALVPYGTTKAKVTFKHIDQPEGRQGRQAHPRHRHQPDAGRRGQDDDDRRSRRRPQPHRQEGDDVPARALARARASASRAARPAAAMPRSCRWRTSTSTSPATSTPSRPRTICCRR